MTKWEKKVIKFHKTTDAEMNQFKKLSDPTWSAFEKRLVKGGMKQADADNLLSAFGAK